MNPVSAAYADVNGIKLYTRDLRTLSTSRLAVVTGYSHYNLLASPEVPQIVGSFWPIRSEDRRNEFEACAYVRRARVPDSDPWRHQGQPGEDIVRRLRTFRCGARRAQRNHRQRQA